MTDPACAAAADLQATTPGAEYRLSARDLGACLGVAALFAWPVASQVLREAIVAAQVVAVSLEPVGLAAVAALALVVIYLLWRARLSWGWKTAAICAALAAWLILLKLFLTGQAALSLNLAPRQIGLAAAAGAVGLALFRWGRDRHLPYLAAAVGGLSLVIALRQLYLGEHVSDVYLFQQGLWTTLHRGGLFHVSDEGGSHFGTHWSPALVALLPIYAAWPSAAPLLVTQSAALSAAAFPLHALLRRCWPQGPALGLTAGFLLLPSTLGSTLWQFHEVAYGVAAFLAALLYFERRRAAPFALFAALSLLVKESFVAPVALFSVYAAVRRRGWRWVALPLAGAAVYGALTYGLIMPQFRSPESSRPFRYLYGYLGDSPAQAARYVVTHPRRTMRVLTRGRNRVYLEHICAPYGYFLPLGSWAALFAAPDALAVLLSRPSEWPVRDLCAHYSMLIAAALLVAFGYCAGSLPRRLRVSRTAPALAAALFFVIAAVDGFDSVRRYSKVLPPEAVAARRALTAMVPRGASVVTTYAAAPYLANRREVYIEREGTLAERRTDYYLSYRRPDTPEARGAIVALGYEPVAGKGGFMLWRRVGSNP